MAPHPHDLLIQRDRARASAETWKQATQNALEDGDKARTALLALLDFLSDSNTEAGFAWGELDRTEYLKMGGIQK